MHEFRVLLKWLSDIYDRAWGKSASLINGENQWREKKEARSVERPRKTYRGNRRRDRWLSYRTARMAATRQIARTYNCAELFLYARGRKSALKEPCDVSLLASGIETARCRCERRSRSAGCAAKREDCAGKEKEKDEEFSGAGAPRVSRRSLSAFGRWKLPRRTWKLPAGVRTRYAARRGAWWFSDCNSPGNWYRDNFVYFQISRFLLVAIIVRAIVLDYRWQGDFLFSQKTWTLTIKCNCKMFV